MQRALIIGGSTFMGYQLVWRLLAEGWHVTLANRGRHPDPFTDRVERLVVDRRSPAFIQAMHGREFHVALDFACYDRHDAESAVQALSDRVGHYVLMSSGAVYLAQRGAVPVTESFQEEDFGGLLADPPGSPDSLAEWRYGANKREAEDTVQQAWEATRFPATRIRLPVVNGLRDPGRRLERYFWRVLDGGPILLPDGGENLTRQVYVTDVVNGLARLVQRPDIAGRAYNLSQDEDITLRDLVTYLFGLMGVTERIVPVSPVVLERAGLSPQMLSPFSSPWTSRLDATLAKRDLGFLHRPLAQYVEAMVDGFLATMPMDPPPGYAMRAKEVACARTLSDLPAKGTVN